MALVAAAYRHRDGHELAGGALGQVRLALRSWGTS